MLFGNSKHNTIEGGLSIESLGLIGFMAASVVYGLLVAW